MGRRSLMVVKGTEQQNFFLELGVFAMSLEMLPEFKDIYDGTFPNFLHEDVHEDVSYCTMVKSYQFAKYLQQFNKLQVEWSHKVSVLPTCPHRIVDCQHSGGWQRSRSDLPHGGPLETPHDLQRPGANHYINKLPCLKSHLLGSVPLEHLNFCVRGKFCHLAQGNRGLIVVKGSDQQKIFEKLGLFTINLETLPHFRNLNDRTLPDHLHDEVHEYSDISECTMVKYYQFA
ncbi:hypothetical protein TNCV_3917021 [Trichonephila clavipes]|nr:hypothetical protein TNCV_3917021 [Trichonephila clavipes]